MHGRVRKGAEILLFAAVIVGTVYIFIHREQIQELNAVTYLGVFGLCFLCNASVLLPAPSLMVVANGALFLNPFGVALAGASGATAGEFVGFLCGKAGQELSPRFQRLVNKIAEHVKKDVLFVFVLAILPLPVFDFAGVYSGGKRMSAWKFALSCFLGKLLKMMAFTQVGSLLEWGLAQIR